MHLFYLNQENSLFFLKFQNDRNLTSLQARKVSGYIMRKVIKEAVEEAFKKLSDNGGLPVAEPSSSHLISVPKKEQHGDYASNFALVMASVLKMPPRKIAEKIQEALKDNPDFEKIEVAGPGFLNFFFSKSFWHRCLLDIKEQGEGFGHTDTGKGKRVLVEFVSANPTGPLHVGHGRGAAVGDSLCRIMRAAGFEVESEYYINDVGNQMNTLGPFRLPSLSGGFWQGCGFS